MRNSIPNPAGPASSDADWLRFAARLAVQGGHTGRSFLASVEGFQRDSGRELPAVVRAAAAALTRRTPGADARAVARELVARAEAIERRAGS